MSPSERAAVDQAHRQFGEPTATPKPRAGEHVDVSGMELAMELAATVGDMIRRLEAERDLLRGRERELVEALERACQALDHLGFDAKGANRADLEKRAHGYAKDARAALKDRS